MPEIEIDQAAKLRSVLQGSCPPDDLNPLKGLRRRGVITLWVPKGVGTDVIAVLTDVEIGRAVWVKPTSSDIQLQSPIPVIKDIQPHHLVVDLPGVIGCQVRGKVVHQDDLALLAGENGGPIDLLQALQRKLYLPSQQEDHLRELHAQR